MMEVKHLSSACCVHQLLYLNVLQSIKMWNTASYACLWNDDFESYPVSPPTPLSPWRRGGTWSSSCFNCTNVHTSSSLSTLAWRKSGNLIFTLYGADAVGFGDPLIAVLPSFHDIKWAIKWAELSRIKSNFAGFIVGELRTFGVHFEALLFFPSFAPFFSSKLKTRV